MGGILLRPLLQREHWLRPLLQREHWSRPLLQREHWSHSAHDAVECLLTMEEQDIKQTLAELRKTIDSLASGKAPGSDGPPPPPPPHPDLLKHCKTTSLHSLHVLLCQCWQEGAVPQDMRDGKIITFFENKGERSDCNNCRGIFLLIIVGKVFAKSS